MLSILIPIYNFNISNLVIEIHKQAIEAKIDFEILCLEDNSREFLSENKFTVEGLKHASILTSKINNGRTKTRQLLSDKAKFDWLLFLDADVIPKQNSLIKNYIKRISSSYEAIFGGFAYLDKKPEKHSILRWKYGKSYEEVKAELRNNKPYQITISGNFLIKKSVFDKINNHIKIKGYGLDNYFASLLMRNQIKVLHINNEVFHLGIEKSNIYLNKTEEAIKNLIKLYYNKDIISHENKLLSTFIFLKKYKLNYLFSAFFNIFKLAMKKNLLGRKPGILVLQAYKLSFICHHDLI